MNTINKIDSTGIIPTEAKIVPIPIKAISNKLSKKGKIHIN